MARINITVGEYIDLFLTEYSKNIGMSKSGLCSYIIATSVLQMEQSKADSFFLNGGDINGKRQVERRN